MVEGVDSNTRIVGTGQTGIAGSQAGPDDSKALVALRFQPIVTAAHIDYGLTRGIYSAGNVRRDGVVRSLELGGHAVIVIRQADTKSGDAEPGQPAGQSIVALDG